MGRAAQTRWAPRRLATATMIRIQEVPRDPQGSYLALARARPKPPSPRRTERSVVPRSAVLEKGLEPRR